MLNGLDLFSGIGGLSVALSEWVRAVAYCERDRYAQSVLLSRMLSNDIDRAPIWDDITSLRGTMLPTIDIIYGGFPCQDISAAGNGVGLGGQRSGLFHHIERLIRETNPRFVFLENVPAIRTRGLNSVAQSFTEIGYDCRWTIVSAAEVGARHLRKRWFLLAHAMCEKRWIQQRRRERESGENQTIIGDNGARQSLAYANGSRELQSGRGEQTFRNGIGNSSWWSVEPDVDRVVNGLQHRVDRIKCLGNSVVPLQAKTAFMKLLNLNPQEVKCEN